MKEQDVQTQCQDEYNKKETKLMHGRHLHRCSPEDQTHLTTKCMLVWTTCITIYLLWKSTLAIVIVLRIKKTGWKV